MLRTAGLLLDERDEQRVLQQYCEALTQQLPSIVLAWTWFGAPDTAEIRPQMAAGAARGYAQGLVITRTALTARGPAFRALAGERLSPFQVSCLSPFGPWREAARAHGIRDTVALPLRSAVDEQRGVLVLYATTEHFFRQMGLDVLEALAELFSAVLTRSARQQALSRAATSDALTGLLNRRAEPLIAQGLVRRSDSDTPASLLLVDLDHFKRVNDLHGHGCGDAVLRLAAQTMQASVRAGDLVARWGGEEFLIGLPGADARAAQMLADKLRQRLGALQHPTPDGGVLAVSASLGVASLASGETLAQACARADAALYAAKRAGRNRVVLG